MKPDGQGSLFGLPEPAASGPVVCAWEGCGKRLTRGGVNGMHKVCAEKAERAADPSIEIYKRLADHWSREFRRVRRADPIWSGKDMGALKKAAKVLVPEIGEERVCRMITVCIETDRSISFMVSEPNAFIGERPSRGPRKVMQERPRGR